MKIQLWLRVCWSKPIADLIGLDASYKNVRVLMFTKTIEMPFLPPVGMLIWPVSSMKDTPFKDQDPLDVEISEVGAWDCESQCLSIECNLVEFGEPDDLLQDIEYMECQGWSLSDAIKRDLLAK